MREIIAGKNDAGQRLDRFLRKLLPHTSTSLIQKSIRTKRIKVNGKAAKGDRRIIEGDVLRLYLSDEVLGEIRKPGENNADYSGLDIVYEDENILLVNKPQGLLCHSDRGQDSLIARIQSRAAEQGEWNPETENAFSPALCNRIDRNTGGIVIAAKNARALRIINEKLRNREIERYYLCAVIGEINPPQGTLRGYIKKDREKNKVSVGQQNNADAKDAELEYRSLQQAGDLTLLECRLITGRTHQIRAQLAEAGHPILGDSKYGGKRGREKYQALWSYKLAFDIKTEAMSLNYLKGQSFEVKKIPFAEKYFESD